MSQETMEWLNTMTLIGFSGKRGKFWHYRESLQGGEPNHYEGAVPLEDVKRRLFNFQLIRESLYVPGWDGNFVAVPERVAILADDNRDLLGIFKDGYQESQFIQTLLHDTEEILGQGAEIGSAGLLQKRAVAWVQYEAKETLTSCGMEFRPFIMACDSCNGTLTKTWNKGNTVVGCDNTMAQSLLSSLAIFKLKHTKNARFNADTVRDALGILQEIGADFTESIETLANWKVTDEQWMKFLDEVCLFDVDAKTSRSMTIAQGKRDDLQNLWKEDERVTPWKGTALGVVQATNTYAQHLQTVRGASRVQRNQLNFITGATAKGDADTLKILESVCA